MSNEDLIKEIIEKEKYAFMGLITEKKAMDRIKKISIHPNKKIGIRILPALYFFAFAMSVIPALNISNADKNTCLVFALGISMLIVIISYSYTILASKDKHLIQYLKEDRLSCTTQLFEADFTRTAISEETKTALKTSLTMDEYKTLFIKHDVVSYGILQEYLSNLDKHNRQTYALEQEKLSINKNVIDLSKTLKQHIAIQ